MNRRKVLSTAVLALTLGFGAYYYARHGEDFRIITTVSAGAVALMVGIKLVGILCHGLQVKVLTDHYGIKLGFAGWFGLSRISTFTNMMLPLGGAPLKAAYLKKMHGLNYGHFIVSNAAAIVIRLMVAAALASALAAAAGGSASAYLLAVSGAVFAGAAGFFLLGGAVGRKLSGSWARARDFTSEWSKVVSNRKTVARLFLLNLLAFFVSVAEVHLSFRAFGLDASVVSSGIIASFCTFTNALKLTPGNLGPRELIFISLSDAFGTGVNGGLHAVALNRLIGVAMTLLMAPGFAWSLARKKDATPTDPEGEG